MVYLEPHSGRFRRRASALRRMARFCLERRAGDLRKHTGICFWDLVYKSLLQKLILLRGLSLFERAAAPDRDGGLAVVAVAEVNLADSVLHLFHRDAIDKFNLGLRMHIDLIEHRKNTGDILDATIEHYLG